MVTIVGIGPGDKRYITYAALEKIKCADILVGGRRNLEQFNDIQCEKIIIKASTDYREILNKKGNIVFIASGEPLLYGITEVILKYIDKTQVEIIPGISSIQYICSRLKITMNDLGVVSLHGRTDDLIKKAKECKNVAVLTDNEHTPQHIADLLMKSGINGRSIYVGENLSYDNEKIREFSVEELANNNEQFNMNIVVITCGSI